jgi:deoxyribodipyrimidine photo-lyase
MKTYQLALHIFRRDLRLQDNTALISALKSADKVLPCFIFDSRQIENNDFKSAHCIQFMANSLRELDEALREKQAKLYFFHGIAEDIVEKLIKKIPLEAIFINRDYTPFSLARDRNIEKICVQNKIDFHAYADALLHEPEQVYKADNEPYHVFTAFYNKASTLMVAKPEKNLAVNYFVDDVALEDKKILGKLLQTVNPDLAVKGGRMEARALLKKVIKLQNYQEVRNIPALDATTKLSAHNKFGTVSIREFHYIVAKAFGTKHTLISEMYWRDFFTHIAFHYPRVFEGAFQKKFMDVKWENNKDFFQAWCEGRTGFPIVDAGMRELNATGYMHNRVRMIVGSFLTKDLHIDWRWGEKYFAQKLIDYDPAVNNGNWQWVAGTGCDAQPYFRIFNPWLQQKKYDPECVYIKRWVAELAGLAPKEIHNLEKSSSLKDYPLPIINHTIESQRAKLLYKK